MERKREYKFKDKDKEYTVEYDVETKEVKIKKPGESDFKVAQEKGNAFLMCMKENGSVTHPPEEGDVCLTHSNPTCFWIFTGGRWVLKCV